MTGDTYTRVYTPQGRVAHLMRPYGAGGECTTLCPVVPVVAWPGEWLGTGDQEEYERAEALPLCAVCGHLAGIGAAS